MAAVLEVYAHCREEATVKTYKSAVSAFKQWLIKLKDNEESKDMIAPPIEVRVGPGVLPG